jgi:hypothetical protein
VVEGEVIVFYRPTKEIELAESPDDVCCFSLGSVPLKDTGVSEDTYYGGVIYGDSFKRAESIPGWCLLAPYGEEFDELLSSEDVPEKYFEDVIDHRFHMVYKKNSFDGYVMVVAEY